jgi:hypothetical protein|tara:strand:- start:716 stop:967 length:252 start_codon:yes stop_codon:yes gene_type:complete
MLGIDYMRNLMYNKNNMRKDMYVLALPYPNNIELPDILEEEDGKVMYFKNKREAKVFMQELYDERGIILKPFVDDWVQIMTVQ